MRRLGLVLAHKTQGRLLDIGSGRGEFLELAATKFDVWSIDASPHAVSWLTPTLRNRVTIGDIENIPLPDPPYDVMTAFNVLEHLRRPVAAIHKICRGLAPDGIFVGSVPCNAGLLGSLHTAATNYFDRTHRSCYRVPVWRRAFQKAGLPGTRFFGEFMLDGSVCLYIFTPLWPHLSLNMMFVSRKSSTPVEPGSADLP